MNCNFEWISAQPFSYHHNNKIALTKWIWFELKCFRWVGNCWRGFQSLPGWTCTTGSGPSAQSGVQPKDRRMISGKRRTSRRSRRRRRNRRRRRSRHSTSPTGGPEWMRCSWPGLRRTELQKRREKEICDNVKIFWQYLLTQERGWPRFRDRQAWNFCQSQKVAKIFATFFVTFIATIVIDYTRWLATFFLRKIFLLIFVICLDNNLFRK